MKRHTRAIRLTRVAVAIIFWLGLWSFTAWRMNQPLLLPMPHRVAACLWSLLKSASFWSVTGASLLRVLGGLALAVALGCVLAVLTERYEWLNALFSPLLSLIRSVPVASFILLAVLWMGRDRVPVFIVVLTLTAMAARPRGNAYLAVNGLALTAGRLDNLIVSDVIFHIA